jgi:hypothetical protein
MHPRSHPRTRFGRSIALAVSASLIGVGAVATTASAVDDGRGADRAAITAQRRGAQSGALATAAPAPVTGTAADGTEFTGTFTLERFKEQRGTLFAVGRLAGQLGDRDVSRRVQIPVTGGSNDAPGEGFAAPQQTPGACSILALDLAPIDLNLLGLRVFLDEVHLLIEAIPGAGALLGNLLCAVAGLLDGGLLGGQLTSLLTAVTGLLNAILAF